MLSASNQPILVVVDAIASRQQVHWRRWWHLGPGLSPSMSEIGLQWQFWPHPAPFQQKTFDGYLATGFGQRQPRSVLRSSGFMPAGRHMLISVLSPRGARIECSIKASGDGSLWLSDLGCIYWRWPDSTDQRSSLSIPRVLIDA